MNNLFISKTKSFYNYITSTHCKDFKDQWERYKIADRNYEITNTYEIFKSKLLKKRTKCLEDLYTVLRNNEYVAIRNYIFREYPEEEKFENWIKLIKNFSEFVNGFADPLMINIDNNITVTKSLNKTIFKYKENIFTFTVTFEKSKIKSSSSTLFDSITGLDKENTLSFIKLEVTNESSGHTYTYNYIENSSLISEDGLEDEICDIQLEMIKSKLDKSIAKYVGVVFDTIVNYELKSYFNIFSGNIPDMYRRLELAWIANSTTESD